MRVVIADDELPARQKLRLMLDCEPGVNVVAECKNGSETIHAISQHKPDVLMLAIEMPDMDGFEVLDRVAPPKLPMVIFTTVYDCYAVKAFEIQALDYLLKPFDQERLRQAVNRARAELLKAQDRDATHRILAHLSEAAERQWRTNRRLVVKAGGRIVFLSFHEIDWVEAAANYVKINVGNQHYRIKKGIGEIAEQLDPKQFVRIHRSTIVNVQKIKELHPVNNGEYIVVLKYGKELSCSRNYRSGLQELIDKHL
jgi:two-component system LytT family response regulator